MSAGLTIAVDAMSGDHGAEAAVPGALDVLAANPDLRLIVTGRGEVVRPLLGRGPHLERCTLVEASEVVTMDERPQDALRRKKDSSMRVAINLVEKGEAAACVSASAAERASVPAPALRVARQIAKRLPLSPPLPCFRLFFRLRRLFLASTSLASNPKAAASAMTPPATTTCRLRGEPSVVVTAAAPVPSVAISNLPHVADTNARAHRALASASCA